MVAEPRRPSGRGIEPLVALRRAGLRCTTARIAIVKALGAAPRGLDLQALRGALDGVDELTLRRNLDVLVQRELVHTVYGPAGEAVHLLSRWGQSPRHPHALCTRCGAVACLSAPLGTAHVTLPPGFVVEAHQILVCGQCAACALLSAPPAEPAEAGAEKAG